MKKPHEYMHRAPAVIKFNDDPLNMAPNRPTKLYADSTTNGHIGGFAQALSIATALFAIFSLGFTFASLAAINGMLSETMGIMTICATINLSLVSILASVKIFRPNV